MGKIVIKGYCPVQASGRLADGNVFYFRARWSEWSFYIAKKEVDLFVYERQVFRSASIWCKHESMAGYMPSKETRRIIKQQLAEYTRFKKRNKDIESKGKIVMAKQAKGNLTTPK